MRDDPAGAMTNVIGQGVPELKRVEWRSPLVSSPGGTAMKRE